jgi:hypothetical protein
MSRELKRVRSSLRHVIMGRFPTLTSSEIFTVIKSSDDEILQFADLAPICTSAGLRDDCLSDIFSVYGVYDTVVSREQFIHFLDDEVTGKAITVHMPDQLTDVHRGILSQFCRALRSRGTAPCIIQKGVVSPRNGTAQLWSRLSRMSATKRQLRVATLCRLAHDLNLTFSSEDFVDSLFVFLGAKCEAIDFAQFASILQAF